MKEIRQDLVYGARMLAKSPAFTAVAILSLALGIGANTAIFSLIDALLLRQLPVPNPRELVALTNPNESGTSIGYSTGERGTVSTREFEGCATIPRFSPECSPPKANRTVTTPASRGNHRKKSEPGS